MERGGKAELLLALKERCVVGTAVLEDGIFVPECPNDVHLCLSYPTAFALRSRTLTVEHNRRCAWSSMYTIYFSTLSPIRHFVCACCSLSPSLSVSLSHFVWILMPFPTSPALPCMPLPSPVSSPRNQNINYYRRERMTTTLMTELEALRSRCDRLSESREERAAEADKTMTRLREVENNLETAFSL